MLHIHVNEHGLSLSHEPNIWLLTRTLMKVQSPTCVISFLTVRSQSWGRPLVYLDALWIFPASFLSMRMIITGLEASLYIINSKSKLSVLIKNRKQNKIRNKNKRQKDRWLLARAVCEYLSGDTEVLILFQQLLSFLSWVSKSVMSREEIFSCLLKPV